MIFECECVPSWIDTASIQSYGGVIIPLGTVAKDGCLVVVPDDAIEPLDMKSFAEWELDLLHPSVSRYSHTYAGNRWELYTIKSGHLIGDTEKAFYLGERVT